MRHTAREDIMARMLGEEDCDGKPLFKTSLMDWRGGLYASLLSCGAASCTALAMGAGNHADGLAVWLFIATTAFLPASLLVHALRRPHAFRKNGELTKPAPGEYIQALMRVSQWKAPAKLAQAPRPQEAWAEIVLRAWPRISPILATLGGSGRQPRMDELIDAYGEIREVLDKALESTIGPAPKNSNAANMRALAELARTRP